MAPKHRKVRIEGVQITGFKCFKQTVQLSRLAPFTCVVGPNGTGKSVLGEAIAFALGGNRRMLRASSLAMLVHQEILLAKGTAKVVLHLAMDAEDGQTHLHIMRTVTHTGKTETSYKLRKPGQPANSPWQPASQEQLRALLAPWGINTSAVDRYVVSQQSQAVAAAADPVALVAHLELLLGTAGLADELAAVERQLDTVCAQYTALESQALQLQARRAELAPHVAAEKQYHAAVAELHRRKAQLLSRTCQWLTWALTQAQAQVEAACRKLAGTQAAVLTGKQQLASVLQEQTQCCGQLHKTQQANRQLQAKIETLTREGARAKSQLTSARRTVQVAGKQQAALEVQITEAQQQVDSTAAGMQAQQHTLDTVTQQVEALQKQLAAARKQVSKAAAAGGELGAATGAVQAASRELQRLQLELAQCAKAMDIQRRVVEDAVATAQARAAIAKKAEAELLERRSAVEQTTALLNDAKGAQTAADQALQAADQAHIEAQVQVHIASAQVKQHQAALEHPSSDLRSHRPAGHTRTDPVTKLWQQQPKGTFFGRLCHVFQLRNSATAQVVNTALGCVSNLQSTVVVARRQVALEVVEHYSQHKIGIVTCKVLDELTDNAHNAHIAQQRVALAASYGVVMRPVTQLLQPHPQFSAAHPALTRLCSAMLDNWFLVDDLSAAQTLVAAQTPGQQRASGQHGAAPMPRVNLVTLAGQVFKADGEVQVKLGGRTGGQQGLGEQQYVAGPWDVCAGGCVLGAADTAAGQDAAGHAGRPPLGDRQGKRTEQADVAYDTQQLQKQRQQAAEQLATANAACVVAMEALSAARASASEQGKRVLALEKQLARQQQALHQSTAQHAKLQSAAHKAEQQASSMQQAIEPEIQSLAAQHSVLEDKLGDTQTWLEAALQRLEQAQQQAGLASGRKQGGADSVVELEQTLGSARKEQRQAQKQHRAAEESHLEAQTSLASLQKQRGELHRRLASAKAQVEQCTASVEQLSAQSRTVEAELKVSKEQLAELETQDKNLRQQVAQLRESCEAQQAKVATAQTALQHAQDQVARWTSQLTKAQEEHGVFTARHPTHKVLELAEPGSSHQHAHTSAGQAAGGEPWAAAAEGGMCGTKHGSDAGKTTAWRSERGKSGRQSRAQPGERRVRRRWVVASSSSDEDGDSGSGAETEGCASDSDGEDSCTQPARSTRARTTAPARAMRDGATAQEPGTRAVGRRGRAAQRAPATEMVAVKEETDRQDVARCSEGWLQREREWVEVEEQRLEVAKSTLRPGAVQEDLEIAAEEERVATSMAETDQQRVALQQQVERLVDQRYAAVADTLAVVNTNLCKIYRFLTGNLGDAYCSYTLERRLLFVQGVTLTVRPDQHRWRAFGALSGGQQALACLALSFALQAALPSPFYVLDEVDAALDTLAASRVAEYLACGGVLPDSDKHTVGPLRALSRTASGRAVPQDAPVHDTMQDGSGVSVEQHGAGRQAEGARTAAQYLVVSHRPQVLERAQCLVGVYTAAPGESHAVAVQFNKQSAGGNEH